jgi:hypothetical protein
MTLGFKSFLWKFTTWNRQIIYTWAVFHSNFTARGESWEIRRFDIRSVDVWLGSKNDLMADETHKGL